MTDSELLNTHTHENIAKSSIAGQLEAELAAAFSQQHVEESLRSDAIADAPVLESSLGAFGLQPDEPLAQVRATYTIEQQLEALLLVAEEPLSLVALATAVDAPKKLVQRALERLVIEYAGELDEHGYVLKPARGFELREIAGGYRYYVREGLDPLISEFVQHQSPVKLSQAALETLAVVAYRQPITRSAIASVRAVNVDSVVRTLLGKGLIVEVGHDAETGAIHYGTDQTLLELLGISNIDELPPLAPLLADPSQGFFE